MMKTFQEVILYSGLSLISLQSSVAFTKPATSQCPQYCCSDFLKLKDINQLWLSRGDKSLEGVEIDKTGDSLRQNKGDGVDQILKEERLGLDSISMTTKLLIRCETLLCQRQKDHKDKSNDERASKPKPASLAVKRDRDKEDEGIDKLKQLPPQSPPIDTGKYPKHPNRKKSHEK